tara:strand:+ start:1756 stop:2076 length:321 start_codon:yes stop_codon:yes gene_type:complete
MNTSLAIALCLTCVLMGIIIIAIVVNNQVKCKDKSEPEHGSLGKWSFYINVAGVILAIIAIVLIGMQVNKKSKTIKVEKLIEIDPNEEIITNLTNVLGPSVNKSNF